MAKASRYPDADQGPAIVLRISPCQKTIMTIFGALLAPPAIVAIAAGYGRLMYWFLSSIGLPNDAAGPLGFICSLIIVVCSVMTVFYRVCEGNWPFQPKSY